MRLGWVDFSKSDKAKVYDVLSIFKEKGAVDELGFGAIRDAFANKFFPGTTTIQTRAKYFCREAYMLKKLVDGEYGLEKDKIIAAVDKDEKEYARTLVAHNKTNEGQPVTGIIGVDRVKGKTWLERKPHEIYWTGLRDLGIFDYKGMSFDSFVNVVCKDLKEKKSLGRFDKSDDDSDKDSNTVNKFHIMKLPSKLSDKELKCSSILLTNNEAEFLKERIISQHPNTLFAFLVDTHLSDIELCTKVFDENTTIDSSDTFAILYNHISNELPTDIKEYMQMAISANNLMYIAKLRYNVILERLRNDRYRKNKDKLHFYEDMWGQISSNLEYFVSVDVDVLFLRLNLIRSYKLKEFCCNIKNIVSRIAANKDSATELYEQLDDFIKEREYFLKKKRSKLLNPPQGEKGVGDLYLDYRLSAALRIIKDIANPISDTGKNA